MATKRKPYIRVARSLLGEPWDRESKLMLVLLQCHMANRWATDQLTAEEACRVTLSAGDLANISGSSHKKWARHRIDVLGELVSMSVRHKGDFTEIYWPKLAEYQGWDARERAEDGADPGPTSDQSAPAPSPAPKTPPPPLEVGVSSPAKEHLIPQPDWVHIPRLLHAIKDLPGTPEEHKAWLTDNLGLLGLEVLKDSKLKTKANKAAALGALAFRYRRADCRESKASAKPKPTATALRPGFETAIERSQREADELSERANREASK